MEQKIVEQIAEEKYPFDSRKVQSNDDWKVIDATNRAATLQRLGFIDGFNHVQQSQPMWREIEGDKVYAIVIVQCNSYCEVFQDEVSGKYLLDDGFTHYLSSDDLLKLPVEKK